MFLESAARRRVTHERSQTGEKHYGRLTAEIVAYLNGIIISAAVSRYYNFRKRHMKIQRWWGGVIGEFFHKTIITDQNKGSL
jgi:hypothetical protein